MGESAANWRVRGEKEDQSWGVLDVRRADCQWPVPNEQRHFRQRRKRPQYPVERHGDRRPHLEWG